MSSQPPPAREVGAWAEGAAQLGETLGVVPHLELEGQGQVFSQDTEPRRHWGRWGLTTSDLLVNL